MGCGFLNFSSLIQGFVHSSSRSFAGRQPTCNRNRIKHLVLAGTVFGHKASVCTSGIPPKSRVHLPGVGRRV